MATNIFQIRGAKMLAGLRQGACKVIPLSYMKLILFNFVNGVNSFYTFNAAKTHWHNAHQNALMRMLI